MFCLTDFLKAELSQLFFVLVNFAFLFLSATIPTVIVYIVKQYMKCYICIDLKLTLPYILVQCYSMHSNVIWDLHCYVSTVHKKIKLFLWFLHFCFRSSLYFIESMKLFFFVNPLKQDECGSLVCHSVSWFLNKACACKSYWLTHCWWPVDVPPEADSKLRYILWTQRSVYSRFGK